MEFVLCRIGRCILIARAYRMLLVEPGSGLRPNACRKCLSPINRSISELK